MSGSEPSFVRAIRGPITLITIGVLFALNNFTRYRFEQTWPVILIVFGLLSLLRRGTQVMPTATPGGSAPYNFPPAPGYTGTYRQSQYPATEPPPQSGPVKGGFGTSAPPRSTEPGPAPPPEGGNV